MSTYSVHELMSLTGQLWKPVHEWPVRLQEMIDEADRDGDGEINEQEFLRIMKKTSLY